MVKHLSHKETPKVRIDKITVKRETDDNPDLSFLKQDYAEVKNEKERQKYLKQDEDRLVAYDRGDWYMIGIVAEAEVSYPIDAQGNRRIEWFKSGGLWGIESDSDEKYIKEVEEEQSDDLKAHLEVFNVDTSDFKKKMQRHLT